MEITWVFFSCDFPGGKHRGTILRSVIRHWKRNRPFVRLEKGRFRFRPRQTESYWKASGTLNVNIALCVLSDTITF